MSTLTLIGERLATEGMEFVYRGEASACTGCPYREQCLTLETGQKYRVTSVREGASTLACGVHDTGVTAVEVEPAPVVANVHTANAYAGSQTQLEGPCPHTGCPSHEYCEPLGASFDDSYQIGEVIGDPPHDHCMLDRDLTLVEFEPE